MQVEPLKRLQDALDAIEAVEGFLANQSQDDFLSSDILQAAVDRLLLWDVVQTDLPGLKVRLQQVLAGRLTE